MVVYKTTNLVNGKIYIGLNITNDPLYYGSGILIKNAIKKYGKENFKKEIIQECNTIKELSDSEIYWIKKLNSQNREIGYNIQGGGQIRPPESNVKRNYKLSEEHKRKISEALKGRIVTEETRKKISKIHKGKILSEETKLKISKVKSNPSDETRKKCGLANIGRKVSEETRKKISKIHKGKILSEETKLKIRIARAKQIMKPHTEEAKMKISNGMKGRRKNK